MRSSYTRSTLEACFPRVLVASTAVSSATLCSAGHHHTRNILCFGVTRHELRRTNTTVSGDYGCPWSRLGVPKGCSKSVLRQEYVKMCKTHHPDAGGTSANFQAVRTAYETCSQQLKDAAEMNIGGYPTSEKGKNEKYSGVGFQDEAERAAYRVRMRKQIRERFYELHSLDELKALFSECMVRQLFAEKDPAEPLTRTLHNCHRFVGLGLDHWDLCRSLINEWEECSQLRASSTLFNEILKLYAEDQWITDEDGMEQRVPVHDAQKVVTSVLEFMSHYDIEPDEWSLTLARFALRKESPANHGPSPAHSGHRANSQA